ncbi:MULTISPECIES: enolase C-terminal domain-like protein [unclassified Paenibacillus]|uniref:enolase C-terminal domain-like protein n=1 Tax=unclassified Paenibacillus TaxID=185978 RepID=UPI002786A2DC|nr:MULTISPECIES: enolase C-terminal domain-like protein [unclassified Paenibacillus]MDQ0900720.1 L-rhamnonate dehydratase [Paenibacillus sp. V4I7]MDQ0920770.1 L-rhamnonate dehydratase [Paenibacillus sp. V4I5]
MKNNLESSWRIEKIERVLMKGERRRLAGCNARLGVHGKEVSFPLLRITIGGIAGYGWSNISCEAAKDLIGATVNEIFSEEHWIQDRFQKIQFPLFDWLGHVREVPVYELLTNKQWTTPLSVPCYDTSLYFDDLHLSSETDAVRLLQEEAMQGYNEGFRGFKIKVGRGAMHMDLMEGTKRDIAIVNGIRDVVGPDCHISIDANNGYNLNLTKHVLKETAQSKLLWIEEAFHEDDRLYRNLKEWLAEQKLNVLITDGEGLAAGPIVEWAEQGLIDAIQYDLKDYGIVNWLKLSQRLAKSGVKAAPHNYGGFYGNFASAQVYPAIEGFMFVEWDQAEIPGIDTSGYSIKDGRIEVSSAPGFGLHIDEANYTSKVRENGWIV